MRGYASEANLRELEERGIAGYVALGREGKKRAAVDPAKRPATDRMKKKLEDGGGPRPLRPPEVAVRSAERLDQGGAWFSPLQLPGSRESARPSGTWCAWP